MYASNRALSSLVLLLHCAVVSLARHAFNVYAELLTMVPLQESYDADVTLLEARRVLVMFALASQEILPDCNIL